MLKRLFGIHSPSKEWWKIPTKGGIKMSKEERYSEVDKMMLNLADEYAKGHTGCLKVDVGSMIVTKSKERVYGANEATCMADNECYRMLKYGDDGKSHRLPTDCLAIHSEIDAICKATTSLEGATIFVTRYPCEACARAIRAAKFKRVVYGRKDSISAMTEDTLKGIEVVHIKDWGEDGNDR